MDVSARLEQVEEIFHAALQHAPPARAAFLAQACAADPALLAEVNSLLAAHERASSFIEAPAYQHAAALLLQSATDPLIGQTLGHHRILAPLGKGGMGEVYLAEDSELGRRVALKLLPAQFTADAERLRRFKQEARAASALNHPNIVTIHEIGQDATRHFIITEYIDGVTLRERLGGARLELKAALEVALQVASGLAAAHEAGIVHRDIKPENIMLRRDGLVKVLDFGLAKLTERQAATPDSQAQTRPLESTASGIVLGTPRYMSPEQARGEEIDARTDLFSLGVVLFEMLSGTAPFTGATSMDVLVAILDKEPAALNSLVPELPSELERIVNRTLRKDRTERYQSAAELLSELKSLREGLAFASQLSRRPQPEKKRQEAASAATTAERNVVRDTAEAQPHATVASFFSRRRKAVLLGGTLLLILLIVCVLLILPRLRKSPSGVAVSRAHWRLSRGSRLAWSPVWSPDGKFIAGSVSGSEYCGIWLQPVDGSGNPIRVTEESAYELATDWSPDGRKLLFWSPQHGGGIFIRPAFGGPAQRIAPFGSFARFSANGSKIMFLTHWQSFIPLRARIYLVNPDGSELQEFRPDLLREFSRISWANWHPDGKRITLNGEHPKLGTGLWTIPLAGGAPIKSERTPEMDGRMKTLINRFVTFEWSPSGEHLYLTASSKGGWNIWRVTVDPQTLRWVDGPERLTMGRNEDHLGRLSPDGKRLAYTMFIGSERIWDVPFDAASGKLLGAEKLVSPESGTSYLFELSADGDKLVYNLRDELREYSLVTGKFKALSSLEKYTYGIGAWAADGSRVALRRSSRVNPGENRAPEAQYVWLAAGGGEAHPITAPVDPRTAPGRCTDWSRDGQWLLEVANSSREGKGVIRRLPLAAAPQAETQAKEVTSAPERVLDNAKFSPDGRWVAFNSWQPRDGKEGSIYVVPVGGGAWAPITDGKEWLWHDRPRWSPDGKIIYYISTRVAAAGIGAGVDVWGRRFDPVAGKPVGEAFQVTNYASICNSRKEIILKNSGFGVARERLALPLLDLYELSLWVLEDVDK